MNHLQYQINLLMAQKFIYFISKSTKKNSKIVNAEIKILKPVYFNQLQKQKIKKGLFSNSIIYQNHWPQIFSITSDLLSRPIPTISQQLKYFIKTIYTISALNIELFFIIDFKQAKLELQAIINQNGIPLSIKSLTLKILLTKHLNKINSKQKYGQIVLNVNSGIINFRFLNILNLKQFWQIISTKQNIELYLQEQILTCQDYIKQYLPKLLEFIEYTPSGMRLQLKSLNFNANILKKINNQKKQQLSMKIKKCLSFCNYEFSFMYNKGLKRNDVTVNQIQSKLGGRDRDILQKYQMYKKSFCDLSNIINYLKFLNVNSINDGEKQIDIYKKVKSNEIDNLFQESEKDFFKYLSFGNQPPNSLSILSQIQIFNQAKIQYNQTSDIEFVEIEFFHCSLQHNIAKKINTFAIKKNQNNKLNHEKNIISIISKQYCQYITKFYYTNANNSPFFNSLIMQYYPQRSLRHFQSKNLKTLSLTNKLFFFYQIVQGLRFLRNNKIVHNDVKPENILIGKNLNLKVADFGQSYHPKICSKNFHPGYTLNYLCPDIIRDQINFSQKLDVFSLGLLIYQILFTNSPLNIPNQSSKRLGYFIDLVSRENQKINLEFINTTIQGPTQLLSYLKILCFKCLQMDHSQRPCLDWISIIIRECINFLDKLY